MEQTAVLVCSSGGRGEFVSPSGDQVLPKMAFPQEALKICSDVR